MSKTVINLSDLKRYNTILSDNRTDKAKKIYILKKLESWIPIKDYIVISQIGKTVFKYSKSSDEIGLKSVSIVKKWKTLITERDKKVITQQKVDLNKQIGTIKSQNSVNRKSSLSLEDYYKRRGIDAPPSTGVSRNLTIDDRSIIDNDEITSANGIGFIESLNIKSDAIEPKQKKNKVLLKKSEICAIASADCISKRIDFASKRPVVNDDKESSAKRQCTEVEVFKYETQYRCWVPKPIQYSFCTVSEPVSLLQMCQDVLFTYRDYIEEVLLTPRELLSKILKNYTFNQLLRFESFNPHFIEDNEELWKQHFLSQYPDMQKAKSQTWRDAFREAGIKKENQFEDLLKNIKQKYEVIQKNESQRTVKLLTSTPRIPKKRHFFRNEKESCYSKATQKLRKQLKSQFSHLPF